MKILIVEDDPLTNKLLRHFLKQWNYQTVPVTNGEEGLRILEKKTIIITTVAAEKDTKPISLIVLDVSWHERPCSFNRAANALMRTPYFPSIFAAAKSLLQ